MVTIDFPIEYLTEEEDGEEFDLLIASKELAEKNDTLIMTHCFRDITFDMLEEIIPQDKLSNNYSNTIILNSCFLEVYQVPNYEDEDNKIWLLFRQVGNERKIAQLERDLTEEEFIFYAKYFLEDIVKYLIKH